MIDYRILHENELEDWFDHCVYVFNKGVPSEDFRQYFKNHWINDPWKDLSGILVAVEDGNILSSLRIFNREIYFLGSTISMGGIGEVSTKPEHQGKGLSSKLFQYAIEIMEERKFKVSMLSTHIPQFYERFGWQKSAMDINTAQLHHPVKSNGNIRPADLSKDIEGINKIYTCYSGSLNGTIVRSSNEYWNKWFTTECKQCLLLEDPSSGIIAYICYNVEGDQIIVKEFGNSNKSNDAFDILVTYIIEDSGNPSLKIRYPGLIASKLHTLETEKNEHKMFRLITPFKTGETTVDCTTTLINLLKGENTQRQDFVFWATDGF